MPRYTRPFPDRNQPAPDRPPTPEEVLCGLTALVTDRLMNDAIGVAGIPPERLSASEAGRRVHLSIRQRIARALERLGPLTPERLRQVVHDDLIEGHHASPVEITEHFNIVATATKFATRVKSGVFLGVMVFEGSPAEVFYTGGESAARAYGIIRRADCQGLRVLRLMRAEAAGRTTIGAATRSVGNGARDPRDSMRATIRTSLLKRGLIRELPREERRAIPTSEWRDSLMSAKRSRRIEPAVFQITDEGRELLTHADWLTQNGADTGNLRSLVASLNYYRRLRTAKLERAHNRADNEPTTRPQLPPRPTKEAPKEAPKKLTPRDAEYHRQWRAKRRAQRESGEAEARRLAMELALADRQLRLAEEKARAAELRRAKREAREQAQREAAARGAAEREYD